MKCVRFAFWPALAFGFSACADQSSPTIVAPSAALVREATTPPPGWAIVYSNFGPYWAFDAALSHAWTVNGLVEPGGGRQAIAQQFTPAGDARLAYVQVPLAIFRGSGTMRVVLQADDGGLPGAVIEEMSIGGLQSTPKSFTATSVLIPTLQRGTPYWLSLIAGADGMGAGWQWNSIGDVSRETFASTQEGDPAGPWGLSPSASTRSAFAINGTPLTPVDGLLLLQDRMDFFVDRGLMPADQALALNAKVAAATRSIERGSGAACNQLYAFIRQVLTLLRRDAMPNPLGQELIGAAGTVRGELDCE